VLTSGANVPDIKRALDLLDCYPSIAGRPGRPRRRFATLPADKAYSSAAFRAGLPRARHQPIIPKPKTTGVKGGPASRARIQEPLRRPGGITPSPSVLPFTEHSDAAEPPNCAMAATTGAPSPDDSRSRRSVKSWGCDVQASARHTPGSSAVHSSRTDGCVAWALPTGQDLDATTLMRALGTWFGQPV
jgi:hypothetical protein